MSEVKKLEKYSNLPLEQRLAYARYYRNSVPQINRTAWLQEMGIPMARMKSWLKLLDEKTKVPVPVAQTTWDELTTLKIKIEQLPSWVSAMMQWPSGKLIPDEGVHLYEVFQAINAKRMDLEQRFMDKVDRIVELEKMLGEEQRRAKIIGEDLTDAKLENSRLEDKYDEQLDKTNSALMVIRMLSGCA